VDAGGLKLGVDGWRVHGHTGVPRYLVNVIQHWTTDVTGGRFDRIRLYTSKPIDRDEVRLPESVTERVLRPDLRMLVWQNARLGPFIDDDVLWCPSYTRPVLTRAKVVVTTHDATIRIFPHLYPFAARTFYAAFYGWSARRAALVITHNETTCRDIVRCFGVPEEKMRVVPLAPAEVFRKIDDEKRVRDVRARVLGSPDTPFFLTVGKLSARRNVPLLIRGFAAMKHAGAHPHKLVIVGKRNMEIDIPGLASELGISAALIHLDYVDDDDLVLLYNAAEAFVLCATYESVSFPAIEAQVCGAPVVIPNVPGLVETTGGNALVMPEVTIDAIARALETMAEEPELRKGLSARGMAHARRFSWARTSEETLRVLEEAHRIPAPITSTVHGRRST